MTDQGPADRTDASPLEPRETPGGASCPPTCCTGRSWIMWVLLILAALVYFNTSRSGSPASAVAWDTDYTAALAQADQTRRPVLLNFHATWCGVCKAMDAEVFSRQDVADALSGWVAVGIDGDQQEDLAAKYRISAYPTFVMLDSTGQEVFRHEGSLPAEDFIKTVGTIERSLKAASQPEG